MMSDNFYTRFIDNNNISTFGSWISNLVFAGFAFGSFMFCSMSVLFSTFFGWISLAYFQKINASSSDKYMILIFTGIFAIFIFIVTALISSLIFRKLYIAVLKSSQGSLSRWQWAKKQIEENKDKFKIPDTGTVFVGHLSQAQDLPVGLIVTIFLSCFLFLVTEVALAGIGETILLAMTRVILTLYFLSLCYLVKLRSSYILVGCILPVFVFVENI